MRRKSSVVVFTKVAVGSVGMSGVGGGCAIVVIWGRGALRWCQVGGGEYGGFVWRRGWVGGAVELEFGIARGRLRVMKAFLGSSCACRTSWGKQRVKDCFYRVFRVAGIGLAIAHSGKPGSLVVLGIFPYRAVWCVSMFLYLSPTNLRLSQTCFCSLGIYSSLHNFVRSLVRLIRTADTRLTTSIVDLMGNDSSST
jgi:hypothetical protein